MFVTEGESFLLELDPFDHARESVKTSEESTLSVLLLSYPPDGVLLDGPPFGDTLVSRTSLIGGMIGSVVGGESMSDGISCDPCESAL